MQQNSKHVNRILRFCHFGKRIGEERIGEERRGEERRGEERRGEERRGEERRGKERRGEDEIIFKLSYQIIIQEILKFSLQKNPYID